MPAPTIGGFRPALSSPLASEQFMSRLIAASLLALALSACHTTDLGRSVGWPTPQQTGR